MHADLHLQTRQKLKLQTPFNNLLLLLLSRFKLVPLSNLQGHNNAILLDIKKVIELLNQCLL